VLRLLLLLLINIVLVRAGDDAAIQLADELAQWSESVGGDCCPPGPESAEGEDCCDEDFGLCCVSISATLPAAALSDLWVDHVAVDVSAPFHSEPLTPRANGPPPFPPPIA
jgi:hypothetical protein